ADGRPPTGGARAAVGPNHSLYVVYWAGSTLRMRRSTNPTGPSFFFDTFATVATLTSVGGASGDLGLTGRRNGESTFSFFNTNKFPQVAVNPVNGHVYVVYNDDAPGADKADIKFTMSTNGGVTWSLPTRVNDD